MKSISIPSRLWYENVEQELAFPALWQVDDLSSSGFQRPALSREEIRHKLEHPFAGPTLAELARGKRQVVIVFDDMTRPTPVREVAQPMLEILHEAGIPKERIRFVWALGTHGAYDMINARKKLGERIVENYAVYNHDPFQNTVRVGRTPTGVELWFNREVMSCDLKIGIGCCTAHVHVGFGGGAKIVLPGVAGIETINQFHNRLFSDKSRIGLGNFENNIMRAECDAAGEMMGLDFKVDCLINRRGGIANLYAGEFKAVHSASGEEGKEHYGIDCSPCYDVAVSNAYGKANEAAIALVVALKAVKKDRSSTAVLIVDAPEGQVPHYVMRCWGSDFGGRHFEPKKRGEGMVSSHLKRLIVLAPQPDPTMLDLVCHIDDASVVKSWPEVLEILARDYPEGGRGCVIQDGTMQYLRRK